MKLIEYSNVEVSYVVSEDNEKTLIEWLREAGDNPEEDYDRTESFMMTIQPKMPEILPETIYENEGNFQ